MYRSAVGRLRCTFVFDLENRVSSLFSGKLPGPNRLRTLHCTSPDPPQPFGSGGKLTETSTPNMFARTTRYAQYAIMGGGIIEPDRGTAASLPASPPGRSIGDLEGGQLQPQGEPDSTSIALDTAENDNPIAVRGWRDEKDRLLDRLFAWKAGEAWREVVIVCGAEEGCGGRGGIRSSCELEVRQHGVWPPPDADQMCEVT